MVDFHACKEPQRAHSGSFGMSVMREYRGLGVGKQLLKKMISIVQSSNTMTRIELQVFSIIANAIKLYESFGLEHEGRQRRAVRIGESFVDILLMAKLLKA